MASFRRVSPCIAALAAIVGATVLTAGCSDDPSDPSGTESPPGQKTIGSGGGVLELNGVKLTVPAGAVSADVPFTVTISTDAAPAEYVARSAIYVFGPEGMTFAVPLTVEIPFTGDGTDAHVVWSTRDGKGFEFIEGSIGASKATAQVTHFSRGFVGLRIAATHVPDASSVVDPTVDASSEDAIVIDALADAADVNAADAAASDASDASLSADGSDGAVSSDASDASSTADASDAGVTDATTDSTPCGCSVMLTCCGVCVDTKTSPSNCGSCGHACATGESCVNGNCLTCASQSQSCTNSQCCPGTFCNAGFCQPIQYG